MKWFKRTFYWLSVYYSPFVKPKVQLYVGKIAVGTPIFYPRRMVRADNGWKFVKKYIGFDFVSLGWKTKWSSTDYRFEWNPVWSFVFWKWQIALIFVPVEYSNYWEGWLYYHYNTKGTMRERIEACKKEFPMKATIYKHGEEPYSVNYYDIILKNKYR